MLQNYIYHSHLKEFLLFQQNNCLLRLFLALFHLVLVVYQVSLKKLSFQKKMVQQLILFFFQVSLQFDQQFVIFSFHVMLLLIIQVLYLFHLLFFDLSGLNFLPLISYIYRRIHLML